MLIGLAVATPPAKLVVSVETAKEYLHITNGAQDAAIELMLKASIEDVQAMLRRALLLQSLVATFALDMPVWGEITGPLAPVSNELEIPHPPLQRVTSVEIETYLGEFVGVSSDFYSIRAGEPATLIMDAAMFGVYEYPWWLEWEDTLPHVRVSYDAGYETSAEVPSNYKLFVLQTLAQRNINREAPEYTPSMQQFIVSNKVWKA